MNRLPSELRSTPPSPRTPSVTRMPRTDRGQTIPVGWNCTDSMSMRSAPAHRDMACPSPVDSHELEVYSQLLPTPPGGHDHGLGREHHELPGRAPVADDTGDHPVGVVEEPEHLDLHEDLDAVGHRLLLEGADQLEAGAVADVGQAGEPVASEVALEDQPVLGPVEQGPPVLELAHPVGSLLGVELGHAPVVEHLAAAHGVAEVDLPAVLVVDVAERRGHAALGHDGVGLPQQRLADQRGAQSLGPCLDGGPQPGAAGADDDDVEVVGLVLSHGPIPLRSGSRSRGWSRWPPAARRSR